MKLINITMILLVFVSFLGFSLAGYEYINSQELLSEYKKNFDCKSFRAIEGQQFITPNCITTECGRRVVDGIFSKEEVDQLLAIANKGMSYRKDLGGPTILDINTGYVRDSAGLDNLFMKENDIYTAEEFAHYGKIINRLKTAVMETFQLENLHFTSPTFITRINSDINWSPKGIHDEYWHPHVDMNNTEHYQYSGLLYLSTYGEDFTGGKINFIDPFNHELYDSTFGENMEEKIAVNQHSSLEMTLEPRAGRVIIFSSGTENTHFVEQVLTGKRFVLSFWFTCDARKEFSIFLDGKAHITFSHKFRDQMIERMRQQQQQKAQKGKPKASKKEL